MSKTKAESATKSEHYTADERAESLHTARHENENAGQTAGRASGDAEGRGGERLKSKEENPQTGDAERAESKGQGANQTADRTPNQLAEMYAGVKSDQEKERVDRAMTSVKLGEAENEGPRHPLTVETETLDAAKAKERAKGQHETAMARHADETGADVQVSNTATGSFGPVVNTSTGKVTVRLGFGEGGVVGASVSCSDGTLASTVDVQGGGHRFAGDVGKQVEEMERLWLDGARQP